MLDRETDLDLSGSVVYSFYYNTVYCVKLKEESLENLISNGEMENTHICIYMHGENVYACVGIPIYILYSQRNNTD